MTSFDYFTALNMHWTSIPAAVSDYSDIKLYYTFDLAPCSNQLPLPLTLALFHKTASDHNVCSDAVCFAMLPVTTQLCVCWKTGCGCVDSCYSVSDSKPMSSTTDVKGVRYSVCESRQKLHHFIRWESKCFCEWWRRAASYHLNHSEMFGYDPILTSSVFQQRVSYQQYN